MPVLDPQALIDNRVEAIRDYHTAASIQKAEIDVSGGVDSAILVCLLARALGPSNVIAVHSQINTDPNQTARAREVCEVAGVKLIEIDLGEIYEKLIHTMTDSIVAAHPDDEIVRDQVTIQFDKDPTILGSIRSTLRAPVGRGFNRILGGGIRWGTGNECEDRWTRFYQKGGDDEVDGNPIAMLSKGECFQLALKLGVPMSTITATPSPDLWGTGDAHSDEDEYANYFGFKASDYGQTFYSYIDVETGAYTKVGLIERVSRLLDEVGEGIFFGGDSERSCDYIAGTDTAAFRDSGLSSDQIRMVLKAARRIERITCHKLNPNCPTLGLRRDLIEDGILTNVLPELP